VCSVACTYESAPCSLGPALVRSVACAFDSTFCGLSYGIMSTSDASVEVRLLQVML
jgi:hypothetical protein